MPSARSAARSAAAPRRSARSSAPRPTLGARVARHGSRVRWDRIGRISLLLVLVAVLGLYVSHALSYLATRSQADSEQALVQQLAHQNRALAAQQRALNQPATIIRDARALGMVKQGERPYVITGQPGR